MIQLPPDFLDFLRLLNRHKARYLLIGGYAVAYHGYVRATGDIDVFIHRSRDNAHHLINACRDFGLSEGITPDTFLEKGRILRFGLPPLRLEILNEISGVTFEECWDHHEILTVEETIIPVIGLHDLLRNKSASGRLKDQLDLDMLRK